MTIFPQLALILYLAYFQTVKYPVDSILGSFQFIFAVRCVILCTQNRAALIVSSWRFEQVLEVGFAWVLTKDVIKSQTAQFMRLVDHED